MNVPTSPPLDWSQQNAGNAVAVIEHDLLCIGCDYNLRTQASAGLCPECAQPIVDSLNVDVLAYTDPAWRATTGRALQFLSWVFVAELVLYAWLEAQHWLTEIGGSQTYHLIWLVGMICQLVVDLLFVRLIWSITKPEPHAPRLARKPRATARIASLFLLAAAMLAFMPSIWLVAINGLENPFEPQTTATSLAFAVGSFGILLYYLSKPVTLLAMLAILWRWFKRGQRPGYQRIVGWFYWLWLGLTLLGVLILFSNPTLNSFDSSSPVRRVLYVLEVASKVITLPRLILMIVITRAAAATMRRMPDRD